jgi:hypothetical protein
MFSFPWLKFRVDAPASGHEYALTVNRSLSRRGEMIFRLRQMKNPLNGSLPEQLTRPVESVNRTSLQVQLNWQALPWLMMRSRISAVLRKPGEEARQHGWYMGQDFAVRPDSKPFSFNFRYALFRSDSWDARIYAYENDLPGSFSIPACSGKGSRFYAMMKAEVLERLDIWLKYAATLYTDRNEISSGPDRIEGNVKSEIKVMAKYRF